MLLSTQSVNVAMLMATYGVAGGFGMGLVYLGSVSNPAINSQKETFLKLPFLRIAREVFLQDFCLMFTVPVDNHS